MTSETTGNSNNDWVANNIKKLYLLKKESNHFDCCTVFNYISIS